MHKVELSRVLDALNNGDIVVYPTDTLYALGVDIYNEKAIRRVFKVKKRPLDNPLPVAVSNLSCVEKIAYVNNTARKLAEYFLPGPLTLILNKKNIIPDVVTCGLKKVAVRISNNMLALNLLSSYGPLTVTSANIHGKKVPEIISDIKSQFDISDIKVYLDSGRLKGLPSTIVDVSENNINIIRKGAIDNKEILDAVKNG